MASPRATDKLSLVVVPQVPVCSPVPISSTLRVLYVDAIICPLCCYFNPIRSLTSINF